MSERASKLWGGAGTLAALGLLGALLLPLLALALANAPQALWEGVRDARFGPALLLSLRTSLLSLGLVVAGGLPLGWWLARSRSRLASVVEVLVDLPLVLPPAVVGVGLLMAYGRRGLLGGVLEGMGVSLPFTSAAVVVAQVVVAAPFFVQAAATAFGAVREEQLLVAQTLGASRAEAIWSVAVPAALPGLIAGASLAWARALGEFGATLIFAGSLAGVTQTMPIAIYAALERDVSLAVTFALALAAIATVLLLALRLGPRRILRVGRGR
ncbi:molybdate ABC transporter permease subunit [Lujinxingia vulgaris]|uniref:Molybdenum transport system permease n=1 Tax=Lujinxingia vulgaris TaxID=2600176 RepID=A0A5C6XF18_9DELT|nr:molybdate ABC transporter permease subunit [Lujinxingia vulgaris]TXD37487.1 molybdate ABC transporter permease subunit [Lujinxingia vulgaris]